LKTLLRILAVLLCLCAALPPLSVSAAEAEAKDITAQTNITVTGYSSSAFLSDKNSQTYRTSDGHCTITLENAQGMSSVYLMFNLEYGTYSIINTTTGDHVTAGNYGFLHEFIDLEAAFGSAPTALEIVFESGSVSLSELYVFDQGQVPDFVQQWQPPLEGGADILLLATHGDDDQLYFAGLFPLYAGERGCRVQVAYMTDHRNITKKRTHEMLNGLWQTGVTAYPVFGSFPDFRIDSLEQTYDEFSRRGYSKNELMQFVVEQIRRFRPMVVVGHDFKGEYGHGMHMVYTDLLVNALDLTNDPESYPELAEQYGLWDVPKTYIHLYKENPIVIDYDTPLLRYDGLTAFQVTQKYGFPCHVTQQFDSFVNWLYGRNKEITETSQIKKYNPSQFGLYRSTVGEDVEKNDFLENIVLYEEQERLEQERLEQERLEQERLEQERLEKERLEQERLEQERLEQERLEQERLEQERLEQERLEKNLALQQARRKRLLTYGLILGSIIVLAIIGLWALRRSSKQSKGKYSKKI